MIFILSTYNSWRIYWRSFREWKEFRRDENILVFFEKNWFQHKLQVSVHELSLTRLHIFWGNIRIPSCTSLARREINDASTTVLYPRVLKKYTCVYSVARICTLFLTVLCHSRELYIYRDNVDTLKSARKRETGSREKSHYWCCSATTMRLSSWHRALTGVKLVQNSSSLECLRIPLWSSDLCLPFFWPGALSLSVLNNNILLPFASWRTSHFRRKLQCLVYFTVAHECSFKYSKTKFQDGAKSSYAYPFNWDLGGFIG